MERRRAIQRLLVLGLVSGRRPVVAANPYPARPVKVIVPYAAGSVVDVQARKIGAPLAQALGQPVVIDNRPGASGTLGVGMGAKASPDGYTVIVGTSSNLGVAPAVGAKITFDPLKDFDPVTQYARACLVIVVHPSLGVKNVRELIVLAKTRPGDIAYASSGTSSIGHLAAELFQHEAGIHLLHVPYKTPVASAVLGNEVPLAFDFPLTAGEHVRSGKLIALLTTGKRRVVSLPEVPTVSEAGFPNAEIYGWGGFLVPRGTPKEVVARLNREIVAVLGRPEVKAIFDNEGSETVGSSPDEFRAFIAAELAKFGRIIKLGGIKLEES
jgi:tripartite-type tricarboxylate transporter receptor subunit TctC